MTLNVSDDDDDYVNGRGYPVSGFMFLVFLASLRSLKPSNLLTENMLAYI